MLKKLIALLSLPFSVIALDDLAWDLTKLAWVADGNGDYVAVWTTAIPAGYSLKTVAHYKMNDNAASPDVIDSSETLNTGTASTTTDAMAVAGKIGGALSFNGTDFISASEALLPLGLSPRSISMWMKTEGSSGYLTALGYGTTFGDLYAANLVLVNDTGNIYVVRWGSDITSTGTQVSDNSWHHVVYTYDRATAIGSVYVDGSLIVTATQAINTVPVGNFFIGADPTTWALPKFVGALDDVRIYDKALLLEEIAEIYNNGNGTEAELTYVRPLLLVPLAPFAHYKLDDTSDMSFDVADSAGAATGTATYYPASLTTAGIDGTAFDFSSGGVVSIPTADFTGGAPFSIASWIYESLSYDNPVIMGTGSQTHYSVGWVLMAYAGSIYLQLNGAGGGFQSDELQIAADSVWDTPEWHHIIMTYDGSKNSSGVKFYVDGVVSTTGHVDSDTFTGSCAISGNAYLAQGADGASAQFYGKLDDVKFFNTVLTEAQALSIYQSYNYTPPEPAPPVTIYFDATTAFPDQENLGNISLDYGSADYTPGSPFGSLPYAYDTSYTYSFGGWYDSTFTTYYDGYSTVPAESTTLYASWY